MSLATAPQIDANDNIIQLTLVRGKIKKKNEIRYNKDGSIDKRNPQKIAGKESEVYAFHTKEEIASMLKVFDTHIAEATNDHQRQIARRNKMLFLIGMNVGIRGSDLRTLKWNFFFKENGEFKEYYTLQPLKQRKQGKFVKLYFNQTVKKAVYDYIQYYPVEDMNGFLFQSRKGNEGLEVDSLRRIIKDTAHEAGIEQNIGSHSLRKSWGYWCWHEAQDKNRALVILQKCFNHSSSLTTMKYIGLLDNEISDMYHSIELGLEFLDVTEDDDE